MADPSGDVILEAVHFLVKIGNPRHARSSGMLLIRSTTITISCLSRRPMSMAQLNPLKMQFAGMSSVGELAHYGNSPNLWH
jgi:hypothetical protein